jgi:hypothetical protein
MLKNMDLRDIFLVFFFPMFVSVLTKSLDTWRFAIIFGFFGFLYLAGYLYNKIRFAKKQRGEKK